MEQIRTRIHSRCRLCGKMNQDGLKLDFVARKDGSVETEFSCDQKYRGYENYLHGGVISSLLDSAMTNCLFAQGKVSVTAELKVRYKKTVAINKNAVVRAWIDESFSKLFRVKAELWQDGEVKVRAIGTFIEQPALVKKGKDIA